MPSSPPTPVEADLGGRICVVTGASSGIGQETAAVLAGLGAHVILACRNRERGEAARAAITSRRPRGTLEVALVDLAAQGSIRAFARELAARHPRLDLLVNNAGTWCSSRQLSPDGIELTWATNVLGYHLTLALLLPSLQRAPAPRVVNVASRLAHSLDLDDVQFTRRRYSGLSAYAQSKQADRLLSWAWARRLAGGPVRLNAMHPGAVDTPLFAKGGGVSGLLGSVYGRVWGRSVAEGADSVAWLGASPEAAALHGAFVVDRRVETCEHRGAAPEEAVFALCEEMTGHPASTA